MSNGTNDREEKPRNRWIVGGLVVLGLAVLVYLLWPKLFPPPEIDDLLAEQLGVDPAYLFVNIPPAPSRYPGTIVARDYDFLLESVGREHEDLIWAESGFNTSGNLESVSRAKGTVGAGVFDLLMENRQDVTLQLEIRDARVVELGDLPRRLQNSEVAERIRRDSGAAYLIDRAFEGTLALSVKKRESLGVAAWDSLRTTIERSPEIRFEGTAAEESEITFSLTEPSVFAYRAYDLLGLMQAIPELAPVAPAASEPSPEETATALTEFTPVFSSERDLEQARGEIGPAALRILPVQALVAAEETRGTSLNRDSLASSIRRTASTASPERVAGAQVLWVDDAPANNRNERNALRALGIQITLAATTADALALLAEAPFSVVVTDFGRRDDPQAGYTLLAGLTEGEHPPVIIYSRTATPQQIAAARRRGALGQTNRPGELFDMVVDAILAGDG